MTSRRLYRFSFLLALRQDLKYALRQALHSPGYMAFSTLVLALGIGTVTAMFSILYAVVLRPLPVAEGRYLYQPIEKSGSARSDLGVSAEEAKYWQEATRDIAEVAYYKGTLGVAEGSSGARLVSETDISLNYFSLYRATPLFGRTFRSDVDAGRSDVAVVSYAIWKECFSGSPDVIGKLLHMNGKSFMVVGVMPESFSSLSQGNRPGVWIPVDPVESTSEAHDAYSASYEPIVRLLPGAAFQSLEARLRLLHRQAIGPKEQTDLHLVEIHSLLNAEAKPALLALQTAVIVVWLIACSSVAGLIFARVSARREEIAVRSALGASRQRILLQFLAESLFLSSFGAFGGIAVAEILLRLFRTSVSKNLSFVQDISLNGAVMLALVILTFVTAIVFGTVPAWLSTRGASASYIRIGGNKQAGDRSQNRLRTVLLTGQIALSITLLMAAVLMLRTMHQLRQVPLGFRSENLVLTSLTPSQELSGKDNLGVSVWEPVLASIRQIPGVREAALATVLPISHPVELKTAIYPDNFKGDVPSAVVRAATPDLTSVLGIRVLSGRFFLPTDTPANPPVAVVNRSFVKLYFGGREVLGKTVRYGRIPQLATVVGVIEDIRQDEISKASEPELYLCLSQITPKHLMYRPLVGRVMEVAVRTELIPTELIPSLREQIRQANSHLAAGEFTTMEQAIEDSMGSQKLATTIIGFFAGLSLLITMVGLYGLLSYLMVQRNKEIAIRMALGATRSQVVGMILWQTFPLMLSGSIAGVLLALWSNRLLLKFLYGVPPTDLLTMSLVPVGLLLCGVAAAFIPARRAAHVDPMVTLRMEG